MKSINYLLNAFILVFTLTSAVFSQSLDDAYRGHTTNDFYYMGCGALYWCYITDDGQHVELKKTDAFWHQQYVSETTPGKIYSICNSDIVESNDYGKTYASLSPPAFQADTTVRYIEGGEGTLYLAAYCSNPPMNLYFRTTDSFLTKEQVNYFPMEAGFTPDEFYSGFMAGNITCLTHTMDNGITYDTMPISDTIINNNYRLYKLNRGAVAGELYLVTFFPIPVIWDYRLYHSIDYGATWVKKRMPNSTRYDPKFTPGRGNCKFYIADYSWNGEPYYTLKVYVSTDCGETYSSYTHLLPSFVGTKKAENAEYDFTISRNPVTDQFSLTYNLSSAEKISVQLFTMEGKLIEKLVNENQSPGLHSIEYNCSKLQCGIYALVLSSEKGIIKTNKLVKLK